MAEANNGETCYNSCFENIVDEKRRVQIPSNWRKGQSETEFMLILWLSGSQKDACLMVLPPPGFQMWSPERFRVVSESDDALAQEAIRLI